jgi:hypothetical protein
MIAETDSGELHHVKRKRYLFRSETTFGSSPDMFYYPNVILTSKMRTNEDALSRVEELVSFSKLIHNVNGENLSPKWSQLSNNETVFQYVINHISYLDDFEFQRASVGFQHLFPATDVSKTVRIYTWEIQVILVGLLTLSNQTTSKTYTNWYAHGDRLTGGMVAIVTSFIELFLLENVRFKRSKNTALGLGLFTLKYCPAYDGHMDNAIAYGVVAKSKDRNTSSVDHAKHGHLGVVYGINSTDQQNDPAQNVSVVSTRDGVDLNVYDHNQPINENMLCAISSELTIEVTEIEALQDISADEELLWFYNWQQL